MNRLIAALALILVSAPALHAQDEKSWEWNAELGASLFFGASSQTAVLFRSDYSLKSDHLEFSARGQYDYGEAEDDNGDSFVNKRAWLVGTELDYLLGKWSPFLFVTSEGSLKQEIDLRVSGGAGVRYTFVDNDRTQFDVSVAGLWERTDPRFVQGEPDEVTSLARWSNRVRFSQKFAGDRGEYTFMSMYQPAFEDVSGDYTVDVETAVAFALNGTVSLKVSLVDKYDSQAVERGATENNDGRLFFSVLVKR